MDYYLTQSARSLRAAPATELRWALISPTAEWSPDEVWRRYGQLPGLDRIAACWSGCDRRGADPDGDGRARAERAGLSAVDLLAAFAVPSLVAPTERGRAIAEVSVARLTAGVPAVVGVVVYGTGDALRASAAGPGVRAVQVVPDGSGAFAVAPLLPSFTERAEPGADDAPVPRA